MSEVPFAGGDKKFFTLQKFATLNTKAQRPAIGDQEFSWIENMMPIGDGNLRTLWSNGAFLYTAPGGLTIIYLYYFNIGTVTNVAVFLSDGTAVQVNTKTAVVTTISNLAGQFFPGSAALGNPLPAAAQYGQSGIIIVTTASTNGYFAWDGVTFYVPGATAPNWLTGSTPTSMPSGVSGTCVETYVGRVWVGNGPEIIFSAPGNGADFSPADGAGATTSNDSFLRREVTQLKQSNGFLYAFADSSVNVISNVQSSGSPILTTFNNQNVDPQVGSPWHNSVQAFGRGLVFAHSSGVYALIGGAAEKVSDMLDGLFSEASAILAADTSVQAPSSAVATLFGIKVYMMTLPVQDLFTGLIRIVVVMWDGKKWFMGSQSQVLAFIAPQEINSTLSCWGTDGTNLFPMFTTASNTLNKIYQTRLWPGDGFQITKQAMRFYSQIEDNSGSGYTITGTVDYVLENRGQQTAPITITSNNFPIIFTNSGGQALQFQNSLLQNINFTIGGLSISGFDAGNINQRGNLLGLTLQSTSPDFTVIEHSMLYQNQSPLGA